jgi:hypothetical protein
MQRGPHAFCVVLAWSRSAAKAVVAVGEYCTN